MNRAILVKSCQRFRARQDACNATWAKEIRDAGVQVAIAEGGHDDWKEGIGVNPYDFIRVASDDSYRGNSIKLSRAIKQFLQLPELCFQFTHLFIVDDDTFVHPRRWLTHEPAGDFECRLYHPRSPHDHKLNYGRPWASGGAGWWMSRLMCELYVEHVTECCSYDDVLATRTAQDCGIEIVDRPDLYGADEYEERNERVAADNRLITCHHVRPAEMVKLWEATRGL